MKLRLSADEYRGLGADYGDGRTRKILVEKRGNAVLVNGELARITYHGISLRFAVIARGWTYLVFDGKHKPSRPIVQLFKDLK